MNLIPQMSGKRRGPFPQAFLLSVIGIGIFALGYWIRGLGMPPMAFIAVIPLALATLAWGTVAKNSQALKEKNSVRCLLDSAFDGMVITANGICLESNLALENLIGLSRAELRGKRLQDLLTRKDGADILGDPTSSETESLEATARSGTRGEVPVEIQVRPYPEAGPDARVVTVRDITSRKQSEEALRKSEEHLRTVITHSSLVLFAFNREGVFTLVEGRGLELLGLDPGEVEGRPVVEMLGRFPEVREVLKKALSGEELTSTVHLSGKVLEIHCRPLCDTEGRFFEVIGTAIDVTERERVEEELRRSRENLATVISNAPLVLFALNRKGVFTLCEGKGLESIGLKPGQAEGLAAVDLFGDTPVIIDNIARALAGEAFTSTVDYHGRVFETHYRPVFKGFGEINGVIGVGMDITGRRRAEEALRRSEDHLQQIQRMEAISRVAGGVAHDFNNLLTTITGYCDMLSTGMEQDDARAKHVDNILSAAEKATTLTRQLLAFSRNQILNPKEINLNEVVKGLDKMLRRLLREDVELVTVLEPNLKPVKADPAQIEQVLLNLAMNARDAMPNGGLLSLETANVWLDGVFARSQLNLPTGPYTLLRVSDTGIGMDSEMIKHVFEPFYTTKEEGGGSGLGLATVYGILKQSGGNVWVDTVPGQGTTFRIYLPQIPAPSGVTALLAPARPRVKGSETVLLVEDEEAVRTLIREILTMHGFTVLEARDGGEAVLISERHDGVIDLLLTDMVMDNMSGRQLAENLRPMRPEMRLLYISGYANGGAVSRQEGEAQGEFLAKPFTPKTLVMKVRQILTASVENNPTMRQHPSSQPATISPDKRLSLG